MIHALSGRHRFGDKPGTSYGQEQFNNIFIALLVLSLLGYCSTAFAQKQTDDKIFIKIDQLASQIESKVIEWRRDIHQHPELSNREVRTSAIVAEHLQKLGMEVKTGVAHTGVIGILRGRKQGPVVALRADMDALPVTEETNVPFASKVRTTYDGQEVGVMHACGHDLHTSILMGVAEVLTEIKEQLPGTVKFIFQPAEEGAPAGEEGGADLMIKEGVLENPKPEAMFALHVNSFLKVGTIGYRPGATMASADGLSIIVRGKQTHGAIPWAGADPIVTSAQIILGLQTIISRQIDIAQAPAIITIGKIQGGVRSNIIPGEVKMIGTIRALDTEMQNEIHERIKRTAEKIAESTGTTADVTISKGLPITYNNPALTERMRPTIERIVGKEGLILSAPHTGSEDFAFFAEKVPGFYIFLGISPKDSDLSKAESLHSPRLVADEGAMLVGVRAMASMAVEYLRGGIHP